MKIAFLLLVTNKIPALDLYKEWFDPSRSTIYLHSKVDMDVPGFIPVPRVETTWTTLQNAHNSFYREALKDPENSYFVILSETCVPLVTFDHVYRKVTREEGSIFFYCDPYFHATDRNIEGLAYFQKMNPQWIILNRHHAEILASDTRIIGLFNTRPFDTESYPSTLLDIRNELGSVSCRATTFADWSRPTNNDSSPHVFTKELDDVDRDMLKDAKIKGHLFARKFVDFDYKVLYRELVGL